MCTFNAERFLPEQLESIRIQTRLPDELLIGDDGSNDRTMEIIRSFAAQVPFRVEAFVNEKNLGTTRNFEKVVGLCTGDIIMLADFDDVWRPHKLAVIQDTFAANPNAGYVFSNAELIDARGNLIAKSMWGAGNFRGWNPAEFSGTSQLATLLRRPLATGAAMSIRSGLRELVAPFSLRFIHDYWISLILSCMEFYGVPIEEPLMSYRQHASQKTGVRKQSVLQGVEDVRRNLGEDYERIVVMFEELRERIVALVGKGHYCPPSHLAMIEEMVVHRQRRLAARNASAASARFRLIAAEAISGRYRRFSTSWRSIIRDLCF